MFVREDSGRASGSPIRHITHCAAIDCRSPPRIKVIIVHHLNEIGSEDCRSATRGRHRNYTCRLLEPLSQISSSNAQGNRFNQQQQEINDVQVLFTPY
jgi:hypothetical protein